MRLADLRPSARKLHAMLPLSFRVHVEHVDGAVTFAEVLNNDGSATKLNAHYPGFVSALEALIRVGLVLHWGDVAKGSPNAGRVERVFTTVRPTEQKGVAQ